MNTVARSPLGMQGAKTLLGSVITGPRLPNAQTWGLIQSPNLLVIATGHNLESYTNQLSKFGYHQTPDRLLTDSWLTPDWPLTDSQQALDRLILNSGYFLETTPGSSACALTGFFWLLSHVIYLKLTKVLKECFLSQTEWWVVKVLFLSLRPEAWTFWKLNFVNPLRFTSHQKKLRKLFTF